MASNDKYDRQLRLWGSNGQKALMSCHVLVIGSGPVGSETLKNLVLPGLGNFTLLDDAIITKTDLSNNFFLDEKALGTSRADNVSKWILELNDDATGHVRKEKVLHLLRTGRMKR